MRTLLRRMAAGALLVVLTVGLPGCGGGGGSSSGPSTVPPAPVRRQIANFSFTLAEVADLARGEFTTTAAGTLEAQCDWTFASNDLDIAILRGSCSFDQAAADQCNVLVESFSATAKPERVSSANAPAGLYTLMIFSLFNTAESGNCQVFLTS